MAFRPPGLARPSLHAFALGVVAALTATVPALAIRFAGIHPPPVVTVGVFGLSILGAGFLLSWGAEAAEAHVAQGVRDDPAQYLDPAYTPSM